ncbi:MAG: glutamate--tRNA ligase [Bdellovibrionales bacterium]|nr:glutamate--tRNA ligase [Bdellovibrionales bacterium]
MSDAVRVRFAPSPTGFLHIGGVRAALFNWLYARHNGGKFLLRIEDTDLERSETRYTDDILASMKWLGLNWDEEPIYQSKRLDVYRKKAEELIERGQAYRCTCTEAEVEAMREKATAAGKKPKYDGTCREKKIKAGDKPFVIRTKLPLDGYCEFQDLIRGTVRVNNEELDDFVIVRSSGAPTYNLSVVVDDVESRMTHVIRGDDHINNTPKQFHLYQFFKYQVPKFAHLPMILGADKKKLSKRHGAVSANLYRMEGYLPETMLNFLARIGWSHGDQEIFTKEEMIQYFDFDHVQKASGVFNHEKLLWLNGEHMRKAAPARLAEIAAQDFAEHFKGAAELDRARSPIGHQLVALIQPKVKLVKELVEQLVPLCTPGAVEVDPSGLKWQKDPALKTATQNAIKHAHQAFEAKIKDRISVTRQGADEVWGTVPSLGDVGLTHTDVDAILRQTGESHGVKLGDLAQPLRLWVTGRMVSAGLFDLMTVLPWDVVGPRLLKAAQA